jgi:hypothetical protein
MQKLRPAADDAFFTWAFLQCLPCEIRVLLSQNDHTDMRAVAEKADDLVAIHQPKHHDITAVAAATNTAQELPDGEEEDTVAAATNRHSNKSQRGGKKRGRGGRGGRCRSPSPLDVHQSPLCYYHVRYGDKAHKCVEPCAWPGN